MPVQVLKAKQRQHDACLFCKRITRLWWGDGCVALCMECADRETDETVRERAIEGDFGPIPDENTDHIDHSVCNLIEHVVESLDHDLAPEDQISYLYGIIHGLSDEQWEALAPALDLSEEEIEQAKQYHEKWEDLAEKEKWATRVRDGKLAVLTTYTRVYTDG